MEGNISAQHAVGEHQKEEEKAKGKDPKGGCWRCGGPHFASNCGKGGVTCVEEYHQHQEEQQEENLGDSDYIGWGGGILGDTCHVEEVETDVEMPEIVTQEQEEKHQEMLEEVRREIRENKRKDQE